MSMSGPAGKRHEVDLAIRRLANSSSSDDADRVAASLEKLTVHSVVDTSAHGTAAGGGTIILQQGGIPLIVRAMKEHSKKKDVVHPAVMIPANLTNSSCQRFPEDATKEMIEHNVVVCTISAIKTFSDDSDFLFPALHLLVNLVNNESAVFDQIRDLTGFQHVLSTMKRFPACSNIQSMACKALVAGWASQKNPEDVVQERAGFLGRIGAIPVVLQTLETFQENAEVTQPAFGTLNFLGWNRECRHEIVDKGASLIVKAVQTQATASSTKKSPSKRPKNHLPQPLQEGCALLRTLANDGLDETIYNSPVPHLKPWTQGILCEKGAVTVLLEDVMKKHPNDARLNEEAAAALFNLCSGPTVAVTAYESGIIQVLVATMKKHKRHAGCLEKCLGIVWNLCGYQNQNVQSNAVGDAIKVDVVDSGLLELMVQAIRAFATPSETLCYEGVGAIFHLCNTQNERVRSAVCGERLRNTIQQVLVEHQRAGRTVPCLDTAAECLYITELLADPRIKTAMRRDPVVGVILYAHERYQSRNDTIANHGRFIQQYCIRWQHACLDRQKYEQCIVCHTVLGYRGGGFSCNRCKEAHYCGPECQKKHWPTHKLECKLVVDDANSGSNAKSSARSSNNKKKSSKKSSKKKKK